MLVVFVEYKTKRFIAPSPNDDVTRDELLQRAEKFLNRPKHHSNIINSADELQQLQFAHNMPTPEISLLQKQNQQKLKHPEKCRNIIELKQIHNLLTLHTFEDFFIIQESDDLHQLIYGTAGIRIKTNIINTWKKYFVEDLYFLGTLLETQTPFLGSLPKEKDISNIKNISNENNKIQKSVNCRCLDCGSIINVVEYIRKLTKGEIYDGSDAEKLQKKLSIINAKCPFCDSDKLGDPMYSLNHIVTAKNGLLIGTEDDTGNKISDPTLYKIAPSSMIQQQYMDLPEKSQVSVIDDEPFVDSAVSKDIQIQTKNETQTQKTNKHEPTYNLFRNQLLQTKLETGKLGCFEIGQVFLPHFGENYKDELSFLYNCKTPTCISVVYNEQHINHSEFINMLNETKILCETKEDQYVKKRAQNLSINDILQKGHFYKSNFFGFLLAQTITFIQSIFPCLQKDSFYLREKLPCEITQNSNASSLSVWTLENNLFKDYMRCYKPMLQLQLERTKNNCTLKIDINVEVLLYYLLIHSMRKDETKPNEWLWLNNCIAPWSVAIYTKKDDNTGVFINKLRQTLFTAGIESIVIYDEKIAEVISIPFIINFDSIDNIDSCSFFEIVLPIKCLATEEIITKSILDLSQYLQQQLQNKN